MRLMLVAQNGEKPRSQIRARLKRVAGAPSVGQRILGDIFCGVPISAQCIGKSPQRRNESFQVLLENTSGFIISAQCVSGHGLTSLIPILVKHLLLGPSIPRAEVSDASVPYCSALGFSRGAGNLSA